LHKEVELNGISPIKVYRGAPRISHLLFVDDTLLFFHAFAEDATKVKTTIELYANGTGRLINLAKCFITFAKKLFYYFQQIVYTSYLK
jgi:hypothetical protein